MSSSKVFTSATGGPVADNQNIQTAGRRGPVSDSPQTRCRRLACSPTATPSATDSV
jgi:hypothetical protein